MLEIHGGNIYDYKSIIDFSANINPLGILPEVKEAINRSIKQIANYPDIYCNELRNALAIQEGIDKENIICSNGAADLIFQLVLAKRPKKALLIAPGFFEYEQALKIVNTEIKYYYLKEENNFELKESYLSYIENDIDIIFLCNPNNPTGKTIKSDLLKKIIEVITIKNILLVVDECFVDFVLDSEKISAKKYLLNNNVFIIKAFTKIYAMPGLRLGYGMCRDNELLERIYEIRQPWSVSIPAQKAGVKVLGNKDYIIKTIEYVKKEREFLYKNFSQLKIEYIESEANFILFKWIKNLKKRLLEQGILIRDCSNYKGLGIGYYRIAIKKRDENEKLISALTKIKKELDRE